MRDGRPLGGSGLGLAICRAIVQAHGGALNVASEPGAGATFTFALPSLPELRSHPLPSRRQVPGTAGLARG